MSEHQNLEEFLRALVSGVLSEFSAIGTGGAASTSSGQVSATSGGQGWSDTELEEEEQELEMMWSERPPNKVKPLTEASYTQDQIPGSFWLIFDLDAAYGLEAIEQLGAGELKGVRGISADRRIVLSWLDVGRNAALLMPGAETVRLNSLSRVMYDNPHYLVQSDLRVLRRLYNKQEGQRGSQQVMLQLGDRVKQVLASSSDKQEQELAWAMGYGYLSSQSIGYVYEASGRQLNTVNDVARFLPWAMLELLNDARGKTFGAPQRLREPVQSVAQERWQQIAYEAIKLMGSQYEDEGEWAVKGDSLKIPRGSRLLFLKNNAITREMIDQYREGSYKHSGFGKDWNENTLKTIKALEDNRVLDQYNVRFLSREKYVKSRESLWKRQATKR
jgi:hypothetical protein